MSDLRITGLLEKLTAQTDEIDRLRAENQRLREALADACIIRHFACMEQDEEARGPEDKHLPYQYDDVLVKWGDILGERVYSAWPKPCRLEASTK